MKRLSTDLCWRPHCSVWCAPPWRLEVSRRRWTRVRWGGGRFQVVLQWSRAQGRWGGGGGDWRRAHGPPITVSLHLEREMIRLRTQTNWKLKEIYILKLKPRLYWPEMRDCFGEFSSCWGSKDDAEIIGHQWPRRHTSQDLATNKQPTTEETMKYIYIFSLTQKTENSVSASQKNWTKTNKR